MTDFSAFEMFDIVSKHLRNRESIDIALNALLEAKTFVGQSRSSSQGLQSLDLAIEELRSLATNYALCSQVILEQAGEYDPRMLVKHQESFTDNIAALSYLNGILEALSTPGTIHQESAMRIRLLVSSIAAQTLYEHFDVEKALCHHLFSKGLQQEIGPQSHETGNIFRNGITFRLTERHSPPRHNLGQ